MPEPVIVVDRLTRRFGEFVAVNGISFEVQPGEIVGYLGPNGSGKSLFADALRGCLPLVEGVMRFHFHPPKGLLPEESIGHAGFEERRLNAHGALVQSRWNSLEEEHALRVRDFLSYEQVMAINPFEVGVVVVLISAPPRNEAVP